MQVARRNEELVLQFGAMEKELLLSAVRAILKNYRLKPGEIDPKTAGIWYSTRGCQAAGMSDEETREWLENLYSFKGANARLLEEWSGQIKEIEPSKFEVAIKLEQAATLLTIINDHRLHLAAKYDIGQTEMDEAGQGVLAEPLEEAAPLDAEKQFAIVQIDMLAWLMEVILRLAAPDAASWSDTLEPPENDG